MKTAIKIQKQLIDMLHLGSFELGKWSASEVGLLKDLLAEHCEVRADTDLDSEHSDHIVKTLGMIYIQSRMNSSLKSSLLKI